MPRAYAEGGGRWPALDELDILDALHIVATELGLTGSLAELRIYDRALTAQELAASHSAGRDPAFLE